MKSYKIVLILSLLLIIFNIRVCESPDDISGYSEIKININEDINVPINKFIKALIKVESGGDTAAYNDKTGASGPLQILPIMVEDVNRIIKIKRIKRDTFRFEDCWNLKSSIEIFKIYTNFYSKNESLEIKSRRWNGGPSGDQKVSTLGYWEEVKKHLF